MFHDLQDHNATSSQPEKTVDDVMKTLPDVMLAESRYPEDPRE